jgi:hypothetical protein
VACCSYVSACFETKEARRNDVNNATDFCNVKGNDATLGALGDKERKSPPAVIQLNASHVARFSYAVQHNVFFMLNKEPKSSYYVNNCDQLKSAHFLVPIIITLTFGMPYRREGYCWNVTAEQGSSEGRLNYDSCATNQLLLWAIIFVHEYYRHLNYVAFKTYSCETRALCISRH